MRTGAAPTGRIGTLIFPSPEATSMPTATEPTIEQRLAALEAAVAAIRQQIAPPAQANGPNRVASPPAGQTAADINAPDDASRLAVRPPAEMSPSVAGEDALSMAFESILSESRPSIPIRRAKMDERGHLIRPTPAEAEAEAEGIRAMLKRLETIESDPDEDDAEFFRAIDSHRPHRPLFEGLY